MLALTPILALGAFVASTLATPLQLQFPEVGHQALPVGISVPTAKLYLSELKVATPSNDPPYKRNRFHHWIIISDNCNTREIVLKRDGEDVVTDDECAPVSGDWVSPYDGVHIDNPRPKYLQIDHVVPLKEAWISGARDWDDTQREEFANDLTRPQLVAVSSKSNQAKSASDPSDWLPPLDSFKCTYVVAWIEVKHYYNLTISSAEKAALADTLDTYC